MHHISDDGVDVFLDMPHLPHQLRATTQLQLKASRTCSTEGSVVWEPWAVKKTFLNSMAVVERLFANACFACLCTSAILIRHSYWQTCNQCVQSEERWKSLSQNWGSPDFICLIFLKVQPQTSQNRPMHSPPIHKQLLHDPKNPLHTCQEIYSHLNPPNIKYSPYQGGNNGNTLGRFQNRLVMGFNVRRRG